MRAKIGAFVDRDREHDLRQAAAQPGDDADREQDARDREHHVHDAHHHRVDLAAEPARERADRCRRWSRP